MVADLAIRLGLRAPIVQAPMAGAGGAALAAGAIAGGALGSLPCAMLSPDQARADIVDVRRRAAGPLNLNFFCHRLEASADTTAWHTKLRPFYAEYDVRPPVVPPPLRAPFDERMCALVEEARPAVVSFHFGLPDERLLDRVRTAGALVMANATTLAEGRWLAERGVDAVIAQGWEAGGHAGRFLDGDPAEHMGTIALVPQMVDAIDLPVIAAGGIGDARGIAACLLLGASAVQIGTAYLHCPESQILDAHRAALADERAERTRFTNLLTGGLARGVANRLIDALGAIDADAPPFPHAATALSELRRAAESRQDAAFSPLWVGQAARLGRVLPAKALTEALARETLALLGGKALSWAA